MAEYKLHCVGGSGNAYKVALYLNCAGHDWEPVGVDFAGGETRDANWRAGTNIMGEVPVLEVNGKRMSQSGAILIWLADTTGNFAPANADERIEALRWILFDNHKFTGNLAAYRFQYSLIPQPPHAAVLAFLKSRMEEAFAIVEKHLTDRAFVLGERPTIADFSLAGYIYYPPEETGFNLDLAYPAIHSWRRRLAALPGWKPPYELMPVGVSQPMRAA
ncbi:MAG: glutathione S-transferase [Methylobacteriaceae bacterium]|jgi:glutathione S-transferase|nr:glutathione S-transferase [Methylobacteriaceae bacterium]